MGDHAVKSAETFVYEGMDAAVGYTFAERLDNGTDALMIGSACYQKEGADALERAMAVYRPNHENADTITSLNAYVRGAGDVGTVWYPRYWHGYLIFVRPLLMLTDYLGIRTVNAAAFVAMMALLVWTVYQRKQFLLLLPLGASVLFLRPLAVVHSLQYSTVFYPMMLSVAFCIYFQKWVCREENYLYLFLMNGITIAYFDLLTYPVASLGVLLTVFMMLLKESSLAARIRRIAGASISWEFGYFGMWGAKWLVSSVILHRNVLADAMSQAQFRTSSSYGESHFSRIMVFARNIGAGFLGVLVASAIVFLLLTIFMLWRNRSCLTSRCGWKGLLIHMLPYLLICMVPFAWYSVFANHSYIHIHFTYRSLAAAVCAWTAMCVTGRRCM